MPTSPDARPGPSEVLERVADVEGWMTDDQGRRLYARSAELASGAQVVEIGSFRGRSMIVLASAAAPGVDLVAIDPHGGGDRGPQEIAPDQARGDDDHSVFVHNLDTAGVRNRVNHVRAMSNEALDMVTAPIDLLYIDGAHRLGPARDDIVKWGDRVVDGGTMLIHDSFSSIGVTLALMTTTFAGSQFRYVGRSQSMAEFRREKLTNKDRITNAGHQAAQLPWFVRNVIIKVLITVKLGRLTSLLGHTSRDWPY